MKTIIVMNFLKHAGAYSDIYTTEFLQQEFISRLRVKRTGEKLYFHVICECEIKCCHLFWKMTLKICRVCFEEGDDLESLGNGTDSYGYKLASCVPEIDVYIVCNPSICNTCLPMIEVAHALRETCIENERKFRTKKSVVKTKHAVAQATATKESSNENEEEVISEAVITRPYPESDGNQFHVSVVFNNCFNESRANPEEIPQNEDFSSAEAELPNCATQLEGSCTKDKDQSVLCKKLEVINRSEDELINSLNEMCAELKSFEEIPRSMKNVGGATSDAPLFSDDESKDSFELDLNSLNLFSEDETNDSGGRRRGRLVSCKVCKEMHDETYMKAHLKTHDVRSTYDCGRCGETFSDTCELETHNLSHLKNLCDVCGNVFGSKSDLAEHKRLHVTVCCGEEFSTGSLLQLHTYQKHGKTCGICKRTWDSFNAIFLHLLEHMGEGEIRCQTCKKAFSSETLKLGHQCDEGRAQNNDGNGDSEGRVHKLQWKKKFQCKLCLRWFQTSRNLWIHSRNHDRKGYFACEQCTASFTLEFDLERHRSENHAIPNLIKSEDDCFPNEQQVDWATCQVCPRKFQTPSLLTQHLLEDHCVKAACIKLVDYKKSALGDSSEATVRLHCYSCREVFTSVSPYLKHMKLFHSKCTVCNLRLNDVRNVIDHDRRHYKPKKEEQRSKDSSHLSVKREKPFCEFCRKEFSSEAYYGTHMMKFHKDHVAYSTKVYRCKVCFDVLDSKRELWAHAKEHFACGHCDRTFMLKSSLQQHVNYYHKNDQSSERSQMAQITSKTPSQNCTASKEATCITSNEASQNRITSKAAAFQNRVTSQKDAFRFHRKCKTCGEAFRNTKSLMKHIYAVHSRCTIECDTGKESDDENVKCEPATLNATRCDVCGELFNSVDELKVHVSVHI